MKISLSIINARQNGFNESILQIDKCLKFLQMEKYFKRSH